MKGTNFFKSSLIAAALYAPSIAGADLNFSAQMYQDSTGTWKEKQIYVTDDVAALEMAQGSDAPKIENREFTILYTQIGHVYMERTHGILESKIAFGGCHDIMLVHVKDPEDNEEKVMIYPHLEAIVNGSADISYKELPSGGISTETLVKTYVKSLGRESEFNAEHDFFPIHAYGIILEDGIVYK